VRTGRRDVVAGYACDVVTRRFAATTYEECVSPEIASPLALAVGAMPELAAEGGFPLRSILRDAGGVEMSRTEAVRVDKRSIPEADLVVPPGYTRTK
jgi:hypothetical protein